MKTVNVQAIWKTHQFSEHRWRKMAEEVFRATDCSAQKRTPRLTAHEKAVQTLRKQPLGTEKIEFCRLTPSVSLFHETPTPDEVMARYVEAGWRVMDQSSSNSLGTAARVTIRFRKETVGPSN